MVRRVSFARGQFPGTRSINTLLTDYKAFIGVVEAEAMRIMQRAAEMTLETTLPLVPVQYGGLKQSGRAQAIRTMKGVAAQVSFGGEDAPVTPTPNAPTGIVKYAAIVNYDVAREYRSGQAFFMETGAAEAKDEVDAYIKKELKKVQPKKGRKR
jgi:hypothetical protein